MKLGIITGVDIDNVEEKFARVQKMGFSTCQLGSGVLKEVDYALVEKIKEACAKYNVTISAVIGGWSAPGSWDFVDGPITLGIVPSAYRSNRLNELKVAIDFASALNVPDLNTHIGFVPENLNDQNYKETVAAVKYLCYYANHKNVYFCMETGQETPITLLRLIKDTGAENIGINLDPANLLMYGKANPVDALDIIGKYVRGVHIKDGDYPTNPYELGEEKPVSKGRVDFFAFLSKLKEYGYDGALTIEREISGSKQEEDIIFARDYISDLLTKI